MAVLQADIEGTPINKAMLTRHVPADELEAKKEQAVLDQIDWDACADPYFYENHRLRPLPVDEPQPLGVVEEWIWYNSTRFSGTRITLQPGAHTISRGLGVHGLFVWKGVGQIDSFPVEGQKVSLAESRDEFLVAHDKASKGTTIKNTGSQPMVLFKFFGPDINDEIAPYIKRVK